MSKKICSKEEQTMTRNPWSPMMRDHTKKNQCCRLSHVLVLATLALLLVLVQVAADMFSPALIQSGLTDVSDTLNLPPESH